MASPAVLGITIRADGSVQVQGELNKVRGGLDNTANSARNANRQFADMASVMAKSMSFGAMKLAGGMNTAGLAAAALRQSIADAGAAAQTSNRQFSGMAEGLARMVPALYIIYKLKEFALDILNTNRAMEGLRAQLKALTGSSAEAQRTFEFITKFAVNTPFEINGLTKSFVMLQNFGIKPTAQVMEAITNQAAKLGGSQETLAGITLALGQAYSKGKLQAEEMNQLVERGVPVYALLAEVTGKNTSQLQEMAHNGEITREVIDQLIVKMGEMAAGSNAAAMETLNGKISNLSDAWHQFEDALLNDQSEGIIKSIVGSITEELNILTKQMSSTLDGQIAHAEARVKTFNSLGAVGSFAADFSGYDINVEKNKIDSLKRMQAAQDAAHKEVEINKGMVAAIAQTNEWLSEQETTDAESRAKRLEEHKKAAAQLAKSIADDAQRKAEAITKGIADEMQSLNDQHQKLVLSERDYYASTLAAKQMSFALQATAMALWDSNKALEAQKASGDKAKALLDDLDDKYRQLTLSARDYFIEKTKIDNPGITPETVNEAAAKFDRNTNFAASQAKIDDSRSALEAYNKTLDDAKGKTLDLSSVTSAVFDGALGGINTMAGAFTNMVNSIDENTKALDALHKKQAENDAFQPDAGKGFTEQYIKDVKLKFQNVEKYNKEEKKLNEDRVQKELSGSRQMAAAASKMFGEKTSAGKAFHDLSVALGIAEMAMEAKKVVVYVAGIIPKLAAGAATMFAQSGWGGFAGVAAMGAVMAGLGYGLMSKSGSSEPPKYSPDTGTVLGDPSAKSQSIDKTYQLLKDIHASEYAELRGINAGIASLSSGITNVITRLFQAGGLKDFANVPGTIMNDKISKMVTTGVSVLVGVLAGPLAGIATYMIGNTISKLDPITSKINNFLFGGKQTSTVTAQGIATGATSIADIMAGGNLSARQFATIETKTKGGLFGKDKTSYSQQFAALDAGTQKALNSVFKSMSETMLGLADSLGAGLSDRVKNYIIPALSVDLKGLSGEDAAKKLNGVISAALDTMATSVFGDIIGQYQQLGEGMLETAVRVVSEVAVVKDALSKSGLSIAGDAIAISDAMAQAAGGLQEFQKQFDTYYQKFYSDTERQVFTKKSLNSQLSDVSAVLPETREGYRKLIESLNINNAADAERYSLLIKLSDAADGYYSKLEDAANAAQQLTDQQRALDIQLMELSGNAIGALTEKRKDELAAMDASLRFTQQAVWAITAANTAVTKAVGDVSKAITNMTALAAKLRTALGSTAIVSDASTRKERLDAQAVLNSALATAQSGGSIDNIAGMDKALTDIAKPAAQLYSSFVDYARDQGRSGNTIAQLADIADQQISEAQQQLDAVNGTTTAVLSIKDAISELATALGIKAATLSAIATANAAIKKETAAKDNMDAALAIAAQSAQAAASAVSAAEQAASAAATASAQAAALGNIQPAPTTYINGQSGNAIWEQILGSFNAAHTAKYGIAMNRSWGADADAQRQYQALVAEYNVASAQAAAAAVANAAGLASVAAASAAMIPGYAATASADQAAADQAAAAYATAWAYANAAKAAVPGINSFAIGTNFVESNRWAQIHEGERIMPAADNRELMMRLSAPASSSNNNDELIAEIRQLRAEIRAGQAAIAANTRNTSKQLKRWDADGMPAVTV